MDKHSGKRMHGRGTAADPQVTSRLGSSANDEGQYGLNDVELIGRRVKEWDGTMAYFGRVDLFDICIHTMLRPHYKARRWLTGL